MIFIFSLLGNDLSPGKVPIGIEFMLGGNGRCLGNLFGINLSNSMISKNINKYYSFSKNCI